MDIDKLTIGELKQLNGLIGKTTNHPYEIGEKYLIRTVTMIHTGRLIGVTESELVLEDGAWIADTGRFNEALKTGNFEEVEPFPEGKLIVGRSAIIDACKVSFDLPRGVK